MPQSLTIKWDASTLRLIDAGADYGRIIRLNNGELACVFDRSAKMWIRRSTDDGRSWGDAILVAEEKGSWLTNAYLLELRGGQLLYFWDDRPMEAVARQHRATTAPLTRPFRIRMSRSTDHGKTWSSAQTLYSAGVKFGDGCWEPAAVQLSSGEIQCFFANEGPYTQSDEQEISLVRSTDSGATWSAGEQVSFRKNHRDGMPAPLLLKSHVVIAIEDNGLSGNTFKPAIVDTASPNMRWSALKEDLPAATYAGAPFLAKLPAGLTLLSFQESGDGDLHHSRMAVCIGDEAARNFTSKTYPLPPPYTANQLWNSLFIRSRTTITAVLTATINNKRGVYSIDGQIIKRSLLSNNP